MNQPGADRFAELLKPYLGGVSLVPDQVALLEAYVALILRWNARTNLTAVRDPEELIQRQIGESLFARQLLPACSSLLDFGSGAGFPGIPLQVVRPDLRITLAESQGKKAGFLREAVRTLRVASEVFAGRVEQMPASRTFDVVMMRAVDETDVMLPVAASRVAPGGSLMRYTSGGSLPALDGWHVEAEGAVPLSAGRLVRLMRDQPSS